ncbi:flippase-like domain-containing protein [Lacinutrix sp. C3R15]|uniref:lysylphosphatidylglycerol synthase domain-containing protein n=1 Tax=Flavobacteriaceae TaxID=49546 RepID=UPI001C08DD02|nr:MULTISPECIES: lysylphosphatidylglycerol synthase domain-containing protein [Flavobacteriaceae]MBU2939086.1 flippase-like domain-containing protein [Lacinutrix sp. C3R15]MDO6622401.1 lysylphosphatidylglycerol synthase domain-containing protein [Oceanihabitans sp. 1_MG-2023]
MFRALPYKTNQFFFVLIKLSIVIGAFYFIYNKLTTNSDLNFNEFIVFLTKNHVFSLKNALFLVFLSLFNWLFEIKKWQILVSSIKTISFYEASKQSLGALTASLLTPNRIGDYGAKALYFTSIYRKRIVLLNLLGNLMQMSITTLFGMVGWYFFVVEYNVDVANFKASRFLFIMVIISILSFIGLKQKHFTIKGFSVEKVIHFIKNMAIKIKVSSFLLSLVRYLVFSFQFYFLLDIFGVEVSYFHAMVAITSMYLLASVIPSIFIFDVIIKGSVAVYIFTTVQVNEFTILSIVMLMWILNFVLPSLVGSYYVLTFTPQKNKTA